MMDLLVQITTAHRINPGGHVIQVMNARSDDFLYYKPSTPIGKLKLSAQFSTLTNYFVCLFQNFFQFSKVGNTDSEILIK